ncbi:MAG: hypothetical protein E7436_00945 [Ruminococcaceae bacterium]|nr:hypothetical protein [Oscillospiraceae bacterium]
MKKKITALLLVVALVAVAVAGSTMAYFTDTAQDVNVATVGNVKIEQHEYERALNADGTFKTDTIDNQTSYVLQPFTQGKPLMPSAINTTTWEGWDWDSTIVRMSQVDSYGGMQVFKTASNALDKFVVVENTGRSDAYIRTLVAIEVGTGDPALIGTSYHGTWTSNDIGLINIDGNNYYLKEYVYNGGQLSDGSWRHEGGRLPAGDTAYPSLSQVYLKSKATNEDAEKLDGNGNGTHEILVFTQAVQAAGFDNAEQALNAAFGDITTNNHPWSNTVIVNTNNEAELLGALTSGQDVILNTDIVEIDDAAFNGNGTTITLAGAGNNGGDKNYGYLAFAPGKGNDTKVENLNVTGSGFVEVGHYGEGGGNYEINNLTITDLAATLAINNGGNNIAAAFSHYGTATMTNCVMTGTTATAFSEGHTIYDAAFVNGTKTTIEGGEYGKIYLANQAHVTIEGAEVGEIDTYAINYKNLGSLTIGNDATVGTITVHPVGNYSLSVTIKAGAEVGTIDLSAFADASKVTLTIEPGATVGAVIYP